MYTSLAQLKLTRHELAARSDRLQVAPGMEVAVQLTCVPHAAPEAVGAVLRVEWEHGSVDIPVSWTADQPAPTTSP